MADQTNPPNPPAPPRPGDPVPEGGLDPTQVFGSPPPPPGAGQPPMGQAQPPAGQQPAGQDPAAAPVKDNSPKPPPPGVAATKEMGYDDEDIKIIAQVGNYRFGTIAATSNNADIVMPAHPDTTFDQESFLTLLRGSISLTRDEKWRIIQAIPKLSQFQIDELQKILQEEKVKFSELSPKHLLQLMKLEQKHTEDWKDLQSLMRQKNVKQEEQSKVDDIRKQLGL
ncbi:MAG: hypothetical protein PHW10_04205 [Candidatus Peribacteraceae bacterium]|nr:hypothetical protein [Candidatus Peribacteraceae bacterium]